MRSMSPATSWGESFIRGDAAEHAFLWRDGVMQDLGTLGGSQSHAYGINATDQVVGASSIVDRQPGPALRRAFLYRDGKMRDLGTLGGAESEAFHINDAGEVVGEAQRVDGRSRAFLYSGGHMRDLGTLGGVSSVALGSNAAGMVVGRAQTPDGRGHAFLYRGGNLEDLNHLLRAGSGWELTEARAINDRGQIVGSGLLQGRRRAYLLTPISRPRRSEWEPDRS
jgi:probable HAF family extracellular repeat protein